MITDSIYLSELLDRPLLDKKGDAIGKIRDLSVAPGDPFPCVEGLYVKTSRGTAYVSMKEINVLNKRVVTIRGDAGAIAYAEPREKEILIAKHILDKQIVDVNGVKVVRVNDVQLGQVNDHFGVLAIDVGFGGLLRRLGFGKAKKGTLIPWRCVTTLEPGLDRLTLTMTRKSLSEMHPVDMAEILSQVSMQERTALLSTLDEETAGDVIGELDEQTAARIISEMEPEKAADVLEHMDPDEAADVLGDLPEKKAVELLNRMEKEEAEEVRELLEHDEDTAGGLMTTEYICFPPDMTAEEVMKELRLVAPDIEMIYYLYVVDREEHLLGVLSLKDLILAQPKAPLASIMVTSPKTVLARDDEKVVAEMVSRYNLYAIPVVDEEKHLLGIITVDDVVDMLLPTPLRRKR
ncbi:MAG: Magnesium transporter MgtE [Syntrophaceae bacterium PtaB.Bin038]|nr:MAG: Magnesium transporter MgtE [Syntrophaceae bacterium PtaB.Bin038]